MVRFGDEAASIKHKETAEHYCEKFHTGPHTMCFTVCIFMTCKRNGVKIQQEDLTVHNAVNIFQGQSFHYNTL
jgi:hypothetical protein